jgi:hypothetical protein
MKTNVIQNTLAINDVCMYIFFAYIVIGYGNRKYIKKTI